MTSIRSLLLVLQVTSAITFISCSTVVAPDSSKNVENISFTEDPFADSNVEIVSAEPNRLVDDSSRLIDAEVADRNDADDLDIVEAESDILLTSFQTKVFSEQLSRTARIWVDSPLQTMGETVRVHVEFQNPFGDLIELLASDKGIIFEFNWVVERWGALTGKDKVERHRVFRFPDWVTLEPGERFYEFTDLPLDLEARNNALWSLKIDLRIRFTGVVQGNKELPVAYLDFNGTSFFVLPPGWKAFEENPLEKLERILEINANEVADRHILVCCALLQTNEKYFALKALIDFLKVADNPHQILRATQALRFLTGQETKTLREEWLYWAAQRDL